MIWFQDVALLLCSFAEMFDDSLYNLEKRLCFFYLSDTILTSRASKAKKKHQRNIIIMACNRKQQKYENRKT